jgi:hypothetical protein
MNNIYLDEKFMQYRQADFFAQARQAAQVQELKQANKRRAKTGSRTTRHNLIFNWSFGSKKRSILG